MQLQARIVVMTQSVDKPFYYTKDHEEFKSIFNFAPNSSDSWDVEVGKTIIIRDVECTIMGFELRALNRTSEPSNYGINLYRHGEDYPFNIDIVIYVNEEAIRLRNQ